MGGLVRGAVPRAQTWTCGGACQNGRDVSEYGPRGVSSVPVPPDAWKSQEHNNPSGVAQGKRAPYHRLSTRRCFAQRRSTCSSGTPANAKARLGWEAKTDLETLIRMMVDADMERVARE